MYKELEGTLNTALGLEYCGGMDDLYDDMLRDYLNESKLDSINELYAAENWPDYRVQVHALKSTSLMIGAEHLSARAKELELAAAEGNADFVKANHEDVMKEYNELLESIRKYA